MDKLTHLAVGKSATESDLIITRRHRLVMDLAPPAGGTLMDFGCGNGAQTSLFLSHFEQIIGLDIPGPPPAHLMAAATDLGLEQNVKPTTYDGFTIPLTDSTVDYVISFEVLEHVEDETLSLREIHRVMKPGATFAITVPNRWWIFETHGAELPLLPWNRVPFFSWLPKRIHDRWARARIYRRGEICNKLIAAGFSIQESCYITAPMDVVRFEPLQRFLRSTIFRGDRTSLPFLSTAVLVIARKG